MCLALMDARCVQSSAYVHPIRAQSNYKWLQVKWKQQRAVLKAAANGFTLNPDEWRLWLHRNDGF